MKKNLFLILILCAFVKSKAQISINSSDLYSAGDTFLVSNGDLLQTIDLAITGANANWDFSTLNPITQEKDSSFTLLSTGSITYGLTFGFGSNAANILKRMDVFAGLPGGTLPVDDIFAFYNKSSSNFRQVGLGATLGGVQIPFAFSDKDYIHYFPIDFGDLDSSNSGGSLSVPGTGYIQIARSRSNNVDGWGTITTPYGTFNALRIRSIVNEFDSIYIDSLSVGFGFQQPQTVEYKWMANGMGIPVLQINTIDVGGGVETISSIKYLDSIRPVNVTEIATLNQFEIAPNPIKNNALINLSFHNATHLKVILLNIYGDVIAEVANKKVNAGSHSIYFSKHALSLSAGIYLVDVYTSSGKETRKIVITD
jgi:hypothetical protein